jgi:hypothetical protein
MLPTLPFPASTYTVWWNFNSHLLAHRRKSCYNKLDSLDDWSGSKAYSYCKVKMH